MESSPESDCSPKWFRDIVWLIFFLELEKVKSAAKTLTGIGKISQNVFSLFQSLRLLAEIKYCQVEERMFVQKASSEYQMIHKNNYQTYHLVVLMVSSLMYRNMWWNGWAHPLSPTLTSSVQRREIFHKYSVLYGGGPTLQCTQLSSVFIISEINPCFQHRKESTPLSKIYYHRLIMLFKLVINKSLQLQTLEHLICFSL